jgi:uncharacterized membrane protein YhaH (DUF805 family)
VATKGATEERSMTEDAKPDRLYEMSPGAAGMLFGLRGRIGRGRYWVGIAVVTGLLFLTMLFVGMAMNPTGGGGGVLIAVPVFFLALWVHAAVTIKRLRHMGYSGWLYAGVIAVLVGSLYAGIEAAEATHGLSLALTVIVLAIPGMIAKKPGTGVSSQ